MLDKEMDSEQREHLEQLLGIYQQRLRVLERQSATFGSTTPPEIQIEIKDLQKKIAHKEAQLAGSGKIIQQGDTNTVIVNTRSNRQWSWIIVGSVGVILLALTFWLGNRLATSGSTTLQQPPVGGAAISTSIPPTTVPPTALSATTLPAAVPTMVSPTVLSIVAVTDTSVPPTMMPTNISVAPTALSTAIPPAPTPVVTPPTAASAAPTQQLDTSSLINVDQVQRSWTNNIDLIVRSVEILPDNTMQWNLTFWNQDANNNISIGFDYSQTYLADEFGNRYAVLTDSAHTGPKGLFTATLQPGVKQDHAIIFPAPHDGAKVFTVGLVNPCCYAAWRTFSVSLKYAAAPVVTATPAPSVNGAQLIPINQTLRSWTNNIDLIVRSVEILPDNTMQWNLTFWNQDANNNISIGFDYSQTYLADEFGNRYAVLTDSAHTGPKGLFTATLQPGVKQDHAIIFPAPHDGARVFTVGLVNPCCYAAWKVFELTID